MSASQRGIPHARPASLLLAVAAPMLASSDVSAQVVVRHLSDFDWTLADHPLAAGPSYVTDDVLHVVGTDSPGGSAPTLVAFWAVSPWTGTVSATLDFTNLDSTPGYDHPVYVVADHGPPFHTGEKTTVPPGASGSYPVAFEVHAGQVFGFGVSSADSLFGPGIVDVVDFAFEAPVWTDLGHAVDPRVLLAVLEIGVSEEIVSGDDLDDDGVPELFARSASDVRVRSGAHGGLLATWNVLQAGDTVTLALALVDDIDGDGVRDVAISVREGQPAVHTGRVELRSGASGATLWTTHGPEPQIDFGSALATLGDVDGDGLGDLAVGAPGDASGAVHALSGADGALVWSHVEPLSPFPELLGASLACVGDLDGDGRDDLVAGAGQGESGYGRARALSGATGAPLWMAELLEPSLTFARRLVACGDVSGDGVPDVVEGSQGWPFASPPPAGRVHVLSGVDGAVLATIPAADDDLVFADALAAGRQLDGLGAVDLVVHARTPDGHELRLYDLDGPMPIAFWTAQSILPADAFATSGLALALVDDLDGDSVSELAYAGKAALGSQAEFVVLHHPEQPRGAPSLVGSGTLDGGTEWGLALADGAPSTSGIVVLGVSQAFAPFLGGVLVPAPDVVLPVLLAADGTWTLSARVPMTAAPAAQLFAQVWLLDTLGPQGVSASNATAGSAP